MRKPIQNWRKYNHWYRKYKHNFACGSKYMKWNQRQKLSFCRAVSDFVCFDCRLRSIFVSLRLKSRFVESKRLCQRIKPCFVVYISFWRFQNVYKEMDVFGSLFYTYLVFNLRRVAHGNRGRGRLLMTAATWLTKCWLNKWLVDTQRVWCT